MEWREGRDEKRKRQGKKKGFRGIKEEKQMKRERERKNEAEIE